MKMHKKSWLAALLALLLIPVTGVAGGVQLFTFSADEPPKSLWNMAFAIPAEESELILTFAGDCTLGGEPELRRRADGFAQTVEREGMAYPFSGLLPLFSADDVTLVNLEGVLSESTANRAEKQFTFIGEPAYTEILSLGSVEAVTLANNHTMDFGRRGFEDTRAALSAAGIGQLTQEQVLVIQKDGYRIGLTASVFGLNAADQQRLAAQIDALKTLGCHAIIHVMHAGVEYADAPSQQQREVARLAAEQGASLVVGHHPHVVQGVEWVESIPVFYSLGNTCFGGNLNPSVRQGALLKVRFRFADGELARMDWQLHPIAISGGKSGNDYCPQLLTGEEAGQVIQRINRLSGITLEPAADFPGGWTVPPKADDQQKKEQ